MAFINKIPRGLRVLAVMAVCAILIILFSTGTEYFWFTLLLGALVTCLTILLVYQPFAPHAENGVPVRPSAVSQGDSAEWAADTIEIEPDYTDAPSILRPGSRRSIYPPETAEEAENLDYGENAAEWTEDGPVVDARSLTRPISGRTAEDDASAGQIGTTTDNPPAIPLVEDDSVLTDEEKTHLLNAVWYRCENPYCKYSNFLGVHHIVDEKQGGGNNLDNLIVLCPYCHDLAHRGEIPEDEMREWIGNRETRFRFIPNWKYK